MNRADADRLMQQAFIVLVRPQSPDNMGAAARAAANMGLGGLILVRPREWNPGRMCALATRLGSGMILDRTEIFPDLEPALEGFNLVIGTTARSGKFRKSLGGPRKILGQAAPLLRANRLALVFGAEKDGLTNEELALCHSHLTIPTAAAATSLNLAQAVMVAAHELRQAVLDLDRDQREEGPVLADAAQREGMFGHINQVLEAVDHEAHYNRRIWLGSLRRMFGRLDLMPHEVQLIRGICRKICWAVGRTEGNGNQGPEMSPSTGEPELREAAGLRE